MPMGKHVFVVGALAFVLGGAALACSSDPDRPPATSSGGAASGSSGGGGGSSSGASSSSGSAGDGGGTSSSGDGGGSSSGGSSGSSGVIEVGLRATVDGAPGTFDIGPTALRHSSGNVIEMFGKDAAGNEMRLNLTSSDGLAAPGAYNCGGGLDYGTITYTTATAETWTAMTAGECTIAIQSIDNRVDGILVGTYSATLKKAGGGTKTVANGQFRLSLD